MKTYHPEAKGLHQKDLRLCVHCKTYYPATNKFFYLSKGKIHGNCKKCAIKLAGIRQKKEALRRAGLRKPEAIEEEQRLQDNRLARIKHSGPPKETLEHKAFCEWKPTESDMEYRRYVASD